MNVFSLSWCNFIVLFYAFLLRFFCFFGNKKAVKYPYRCKVLIYCYLVIFINVAMSWDVFARQVRGHTILII